MTVTDGDIVDIAITPFNDAIEDPAGIAHYRKFRAALDKYDNQDSLRHYLSLVEGIHCRGKMDRADVLIEVIESLIGWPEFWAWVANCSESSSPYPTNPMWLAMTQFIEEED